MGSQDRMTIHSCSIETPERLGRNRSMGRREGDLCVVCVDSWSILYTLVPVFGFSLAPFFSVGYSVAYFANILGSGIDVYYAERELIIGFIQQAAQRSAASAKPQASGLRSPALSSRTKQKLSCKSKCRTAGAPQKNIVSAFEQSASFLPRSPIQRQSSSSTSHRALSAQVLLPPLELDLDHG